MAMTLNDFRKKIPQLEGLDDETALNVLHEVYYPDADKARMATALGVKVKTPEPVRPQNTMMGFIGDRGLDLVKGAVAVPEAAVGVADLVTGGAAGRAAEEIGFRPREAKEMLSGMQSDAYHDRQAQFQAADGIVAKTGVALTNPSLIAGAVTESLPLMAAGGAVGRGVMAVAPKMASTVGAGALGEGAVAAGSTAEQIRQQTADGYLTPKQALLSAAAGVGTAVFGYAGGKVADGAPKLGKAVSDMGFPRVGERIAKGLGVNDVDTLLVRGSMQATRDSQIGVIKRVAGGMFSESMLEELPQSVVEQMAQNIALDKPVMQDVDSAIVMGALSSAPMGGSAALLSRPKTPTEQAADTIRTNKVPEAGTLSKAVNTGIEASAKAVEATAPIAPAPSLTGFDPSTMIPENPLLAGARVREDDNNQAAMTDDAMAKLERMNANDMAVINSARFDQSRGANEISPTEVVEPAQAGDILNPQGAPFKNKTAATRAQKKAGGEIVKVAGGWAVRGTNVSTTGDVSGLDTGTPGAGPAEPAPAEGPGSDAGNGFKQGPKAGERYRVGVVASVGGAVSLEKRLPAGTAATFYIGKDGNLIDGDSVNLIGDGKDRLWIPATPEQAQQAQAILDEMGRLELNDPARKDAKARLKALVQGKPTQEPNEAARPQAQAAAGESAAPAAAPADDTNPTSGTRTEAQAPADQAPAPARSDAAAAAGVPATPGAGDVQADGVTSSVDSIAQAINASIADGAIKKNSKFYAEKVAKGYMTQEEADRRAAADAKTWSEQKPKPTDRTLKIAKAIADKDPTVLVGAWANEGQGTYGNEGSMEAFRKLTGINLKRLNSADRAKAIFDWAGWSEDQVRADVEKRKAAKAEAAAAYEAKEAAERAEMTERQADKTPLRVQGKDGETTVKAYVDDLIAQGYTDIGQTQKGAVKQVLLFNPKTNSGYPMPKGILADYAKQAVEKAKASKAAQQPAEGAKSEPFEHAGLKIRPSRVKEGDQVVDRWVVQSPENAEREARGERQIGGDRIVETREQAIKTADQEAKRYAKEKADRAEMDAREKAERDAAEAKKEASRGKTLLERRADAILDKPGKFPASAGLGLGTRREAMDKAIEQGRLVTEVMVDDTAAKKRDQDAVDAVRRAGYILGASNENIPVVKRGLEAQARLKEGKYQKPEYRVYQGSDRNGSFFEITKTEYDYAQELKAQRAAAPQAAESPTLQTAMGDAGWAGETGQGDTIWTKRANGERYTALLSPDAGSMEVTVLVGAVDTQIASFKVGDAKAAAEAANKAVAQDVAEQSPADDALPNGWTKSVNGYTKRPVYRMVQDTGQPFAVVTQVEGMRYEVQIRHGDKQLIVSNQTGALSEVLAKAETELTRMTQADSVTHQDPGEKAEAATPGVVTDSLKKAARNEDTKPSEMRKWLVAEIDKELLQAADRPDYDEAVKRMGEKDAISGYTGNGPLGKNSETGYITFDVPGDGKYKVRNSVRGLLEFRKNVMASQGFKDSGQKTLKPEQNDGVQGGSGGQMAAVTNMIEEGDFEAARDYAEAVGIKLEDVKVPRGDMKPAWEKYLKDGTLPPAPWIPSKEWQFQDIGASSLVPESEKRSATLTRVADGSTYVATVKGYLDGSSATYALTKDGKEVGRPSSRNSFTEVMRMAEDAMPKANDKPAPSKANDTGWNMAGTGYGGKRYRGRNITTADGREIVARVYENAGNYEEAEVKVDGVRKFAVTDRNNAQDKADAFIKTLTDDAPMADRLATKEKMAPRQFDDWIRQRATFQTEQFRGDRNHGGGDEGVGYIHLSGKVEAGGTNWAGTARGSQDKRDTRLIFRTDDNKIVWYDDASQQVYEVPKDDARLEIIRAEPTPKQARDPQEITVTVDEADYTVTFDEPLATISNQAFQDNLDEYGTPGVAKAEFRKLRAQAQAGGEAAPATGPRRDPTKVSMFNPYEDGDIVTIDGQDWTVKQDTPGWYLTNTGNWRGTHPTIRNVKAMADLIRAVEQAAVAQPAEAQPDTPKLTPAEAKSLMAWQDMGQTDGVKTHALTFYESQADKDAKRGRMIVAKVSKGDRSANNWMVEGDDKPLAVLGMAKKRAEEIGMAKAVADGFVEEVNPFAEYDAVAKQYGYEVRPDGMIGSDGKFPGPKMAVQRGRLRVESGAGNLLGSYAATPASIGKFLEAFWYAEKKAVRGSAPAQQEAQQATDDRTKPEPVAPIATKIEDFGEKLEGARKDYAAKLKDAEAVDIATEPLSKSWPEPDYDKLLSGGADPYVVAFVHAARDEVPTKPVKAWKLKGWVQSVEMLRGMSTKLLDGTTSRRSFDAVLSRSEFDALRRAVGSRAELYELVGHAKSLKGVTYSDHFYNLYKGQENVRKWVVEQKAKATAFSNWPRELAVGDTKAEMLEKFKAKLASESLGGDKANAKGQFIIYRKRNQDGAFIGKKIGREYIDLKKLPDVAAARAYLESNTADLSAALERYKDTPFERNAENRPRVGDSHRNGAAVTPEVFAETFGFRGVQFGNYVEQGRRQSDLNQTFDALMDMAAVLGLPPRALSLNGRLGLAFGARGNGGKNAPAAHYEPDTVVINLTKGNGPGSLGHEWWHAVDNYFGKEFGSGGFATDGVKVDRLRAEMQTAFKAVRSATQAPTLRRRAAELDKRRSKPYWNTPLELSARSFESYLIAKLNDQSAANDYLANVVDEKVWNISEEARATFFGGEAVETYPYPGQAELPAVRAAFDEFFKTVDTRETDNGVAMFSRGNNSSAQLSKTQIQRAVDKLTLNWLKKPDIHILDSMDDAPDPVRRVWQSQDSKGARGKIEGFHYKGGVYIVADAMESGTDIIRVLFHESLGHFGLRNVFGAALDGILKQIAAARPADMRRKATQYGFDLKNDRDRMAAAEELLAEMAQDRPEIGFVQRAIAAIRTWLRENVEFFRDLDLTDAEIIRNFLEPARDFVERGMRGEASVERALAFSRSYRPVWYSALAKSLESAPMKAAPTFGWMSTIDGLVKAGKVKADEVEWSGIRDWLKLQTGKVTRQQVLDYLDANGVQVQEVVLGGDPLEADGAEQRRTQLEEMDDDDFRDEVDAILGIEVSDDQVEQDGRDDLIEEIMREEADSFDSRANDSAPTKYSQYTLPGGENYREVLLTLPTGAKVKGELERAADGEMMIRWADGTGEYLGTKNRVDAQRMLDAKTPDTAYKSSHWDTTNVLAHIRLNDRVDSDGAKTLFVEEIQSDWGQQGKKEGFSKPEPLKSFEIVPVEGGFQTVWDSGQRSGVWTTEERARSEAERYLRDSKPVGPGVPSAPFVTKTDAWLSLALKRIVKMAVDEGYDRVAFVNGEQSAERYDLSKRVEEIRHLRQQDGTYDLAIKQEGSRPMVTMNGRSLSGLKESDLEELVGKEIAKKIVAQEGPRGGDGFHKLSGLDLKVGGEGMKSFYDKIVPNTLKEVLRKVGGGQVETVSLERAGFKYTVREAGAGRFEVLKDGELEKAYRTWDEAMRDVKMRNERDGGETLSQPGFTITPAMREKVAGGLPLFSRAADLRKEAAGQVVELFHTATNVPGRMNWWHKTVGTMYNLAQRSPEFKRVFSAVQDFIDDTAYYADRAARLAPNILPKLETWRDVFKSPMSAIDNRAIRAPIFEGTLTWMRDESGKPVKAEDVRLAAEDLTTDQKAQRLLRNDFVTDSTLRMWRGLPLEQYESIIEGSYERHMLRAGIVFTPDELKSLFKLTDGQVKLYQEFRRATDMSLTNLAISEMVKLGGQDTASMRQAALESEDVVKASAMLRDHLLELSDSDAEKSKGYIDAANKIIALSDKAKNLMDKGYAPLSRFGHYTVDVVGPDGTREYFGMFESRFEAAKMAEAMAKNYPDARIERGTVSEQAYKLFAGVTPETIELFGEILGLDTQGDGTQNQAFKAFVQRATANRSAMKRLLERKGIAGFSEDAGRVLAGFVFSNGRRTAGNLHGMEMKEAAEAIPKQQGELKDHAVALVEYVQNPQEEAQGLRGLLFTQYIGGSIASAIVNMTQPLTMSLPYLSQFGGITQAGRQMARAVKDVGKTTTGDKALDAAMTAAEEKGIVSPQEVHQLQQQAAGRAALQVGDGTMAGDARAKAGNALSKTMLAWGKLFSAAEQFNRRVTFIAAYRTAVEQKIENPAKFAEDAVIETQGLYNKGNKPKWARGAIGSTLFTFKQYSVAYVEMLGRLAQSGPEGRRAALYALAILFMLSGAGGMPGADDLDDLISGLMQKLGYNFNSKSARRAFFAKHLGQAGSDFVERGVSGIAGVPIDISGRMGLGNLIPGTGLLTKKTDHTSDVAELAGPAGDLAKRAFQAGSKAMDGDLIGKDGAVTTIAPLAVRNLSQAADMAEHGMYRDARGRKVVETDQLDALSKAFGFQPNDVKRVQDATREVQQMISLNKVRETEIADQWAKAMFERDKDGVQEARDALKRWNADNPESPIRISMQQINKRLANMRMSKEDRMAKTASKEIRATVRRELEAAR